MDDRDLKFIASKQGTAVHIGRGHDSRYRGPGVLCGSLTSYSNWYVVETTDDRYPTSVADICGRCRESKEAEGFLVETDYKKPPKMVETRVVIDVRIPKRLNVDGLREVSEEFEDLLDRYKGTADVIDLNIKQY